MDLQTYWDTHNKGEKVGVDGRKEEGGVGTTCGNAEYCEFDVGMGPFDFNQQPVFLAAAGGLKRSVEVCASLCVTGAKRGRKEALLNRMLVTTLCFEKTGYNKVWLLNSTVKIMMVN
ncbi:hypothetical protein XENOCAPTIV_029668 [Xenoophorus captivus]|uniref:Uncharacterized protein n=1 Tax=Xenoophorus captivus TaxID=1517983 RepID=A0ABV0RWJ4_9TELE